MKTPVILFILSIFVLCIFSFRVYEKFTNNINTNTNTNTTPTIDPDYPCKVYL